MGEYFARRTGARRRVGGHGGGRSEGVAVGSWFVGTGGS